MRLLADLHISPRTVRYLPELGHDIIRVTEVLPPTASDQIILAKAVEVGRTVLTQDLDFSHLIALSGSTVPSLMTLRLSPALIEHVNTILQRTLPELEADIQQGMVVTVEDHRMRRRPLPLPDR